MEAEPGIASKAHDRLPSFHWAAALLFGLIVLGAFPSNGAQAQLRPDQCTFDNYGVMIAKKEKLTKEQFGEYFVSTAILPDIPADSQAIGRLMMAQKLTADAAIKEHLEKYYADSPESERARVRAEATFYTKPLQEIRSLAEEYEYQPLSIDWVMKEIKTGTVGYSATMTFSAPGKMPSYFAAFFKAAYNKYKTVYPDWRAVASAYNDAINQRNRLRGSSSIPKPGSADYERDVLAAENYIRRMQFSDAHPVGGDQANNPNYLDNLMRSLGTDHGKGYAFYRCDLILHIE